MELHARGRGSSGDQSGPEPAGPEPPAAATVSSLSAPPLHRAASVGISSAQQSTGKPSPLSFLFKKNFWVSP